MPEKGRLKGGRSQDWLPHVTAGRKQSRRLSKVSCTPQAGGLPIRRRLTTCPAKIG
jgi:hypothetical protein